VADPSPRLPHDSCRFGDRYRRREATGILRLAINQEPVSLGRVKMRQVRAVLALLAVGLVTVAACSGGETLLGEHDGAVEGDADAAEDVGHPDDTTEVADEAGEEEEVGPVCGNGALEFGENCDLLDLNGETCVSLGHEAGGTLRCDAACRFDETFCRNPECGNGACDLGETASGCPADCTDGCGDGTCAEAEDQFGCPADCGAVDVSIGVADSCYLGEGVNTCVLLGDGTVRCWGQNDRGQLGDGATTDSDVPVGVVDLARAVDVETAGSHSCALLDDGTARCWGANGVGQLGDGMTTDSPVPVAVSGLAGAVAVAVQTSQTYFLLADGTVRYWGSSGPYSFVFDPVFRTMAIPDGCGLLLDGRVMCEGFLDQGVARAVGFSLGDWLHRCALLFDGSVKCWGGNAEGQLGDGSYASSDEPVLVHGLSGAVAVAAGVQNSCAILADGTVLCWGLMDRAFTDPCGSGTDLGTHHTEPVAVPGLTGVVAVAAGGESCAPPAPFCGSPSYAAVACAVLRDGTAWCWGSGQLGDGTTTDSNVPVQVAAW
jgi:hypothetical protein